MKISTHKFSRSVALIIIGSILFQCCKVYEKRPTTLDEAMRVEQKQVKIVTIDGKKMYFDSLYYKRNELYGFLSKNNYQQQAIEINIPEETIKSIHLLNLKGSRIRTAAFIISIPIVLFGLVLLIAYIKIEKFGL
jgi:hypothetical protein